jgi:CRP-like cAMP-binding protein
MEITVNDDLTARCLLWVSQSDLAAMAGIARENVSRIQNDWIRDKLVSRLSGYYCLENKARLKRETAL